MGSEIRLPVPIKHCVDDSSIWIKVLLWGDSGSGKTHTSATVGTNKNKVIFCCAEEQGKLSIANGNEDALVYVVNSVKDVYDFLKLIKSDGFKEKYGVDSIVFDSLTEIQRLFADDIKGESDTLQIKDYLLLHERMLKFLRFLRNLEFHVVCTALAVHNSNPDGTSRVEPMFIGQKMCNMIAQFFNLVGYMTKVEITKDDTKKLMHRVILNSTSAYITKGTPQLNAVEEPNLRVWVDKISSRKKAEDTTPHDETQEPKQTTTRRRRRSR